MPSTEASGLHVHQAEELDRLPRAELGTSGPGTRPVAVSTSRKTAMTSGSDGATLSLLGRSDQTVSPADEDIRGRVVVDQEGKDFGRIVDLFIDEREQRVRFLLVEHGGFLGFDRAKTLIPVESVTAVGADVRIDHSKDHVANGPGYDPELMTKPVYLGSVYDHYGHTPFWGVGYGYLTPTQGRYPRTEVI